ncbi:hypothetical protein RJ640_019013, partial [Escallonia rubra]
MEEEVDNEVALLEGIDGTHVRRKESEYLSKPGSSDTPELREVVIPTEGNNHARSPDMLAELLDGKILERIGASEHASASPRCMKDAGDMVEELTLRNYNCKNLTAVGTSNNRERIRTRQNQWQHLYHIAGGSASGGSLGDAAYRDNRGPMYSAWEDVGRQNFTETTKQKPPNETREHFPVIESKPHSSNTILSPGGIRTKILSKSGFSEYFVKNTLQGKGAICRGPAHKGPGVEFGALTFPRAAGVTIRNSDAPLNTNGELVVAPSNGNAQPWLCRPDAFHDGVSLREWLSSGKNKVNKVKSLSIYRQIVALVELSHSQGLALRELRPSCFKLLPSNQVMYLGSSFNEESRENVRGKDIHHSTHEKRPSEQDNFPFVGQCTKKRKFVVNTNFISGWPQFSNRSGFTSASAYDHSLSNSGSEDFCNDFNEDYNSLTGTKKQRKSSSPYVNNTSQPLPTDSSEESWYTSPEELNEKCSTFSSNIYSLGVLLFELLASFDSRRAHAVAMLDLHHRIFPPKFLSENSKEAGFCLRLLHPEPSARPSTREVLQSEIIGGVQDTCGDELSLSINQEDAESELLLHFLVTLKEEQQKNAAKLKEEIMCFDKDIEEVVRRQINKSLVLSRLPDDPLNLTGCSLFDRGNPSLEVNFSKPHASISELRLMTNISQLESSYLSVRSNVQLCENDETVRADTELLKSRENWCQAPKDAENHKPTDRLGVFFDGLCKYARYSKFEVRGVLRNGEFSNSANVICSLNFDRDEDHFATAGVSRKIKIYDFHALLNNSVDIHYPVTEISNKSRLSCISWNSYVRNYLASTDYDGVVKLWDAETGQGISQYVEHNKRSWSVDFSRVDPTKLASGSDDCSVKLWSINEACNSFLENIKNSFCTVRNIANICCVQFSGDSPNLLAFGSADYKIYCYDLRNTSTPWCILAGHDKAVSYVKFLDCETLVSASTDSTVKIWDLNKTSSSGFSTHACISSLRGHTNEKNFVGLSVADGYIACGSETNEVFAYYRSLPMPITSHKFGSIDPVSGKETDDDNGQFVSSVCWRQKSNMVVSANSSGCIKLLQM